MTNNATSLPATALEGLRLPELQARYLEVVGQPTKCPNRKWLLARIAEAATTMVEASAVGTDQPPVGTIQTEGETASTEGASGSAASNDAEYRGVTIPAPATVPIGDVVPGSLVRSAGGTVVRVVGPAKRGRVSVAHLNGTGRESVSADGVPATTPVAVLTGAEFEVEEARWGQGVTGHNSDGAGTGEGDGAAQARRGVAKPRDPRLPTAGTVLRKEHGGEVHEVLVLEAGFEYRGQRYRGISGVAKAVTGQVWNGYLWAFGREVAGKAGRKRAAQDQAA